MVYTNVKFNISDPIWQKVYDAAEEKARLNVLSFCSRPVLIEGGGYNGIWLETQPMGGEMYAMRNMEAPRSYASPATKKSRLTSCSRIFRGTASRITR